ncbi:MAG: UDP-glucose 4-epimerase GalE [Pseudomonadota bacterium]|nr:UDP-glucose 4-epimerase GalE [Pseudomonadota bacterium]
MQSIFVAGGAGYIGAQTCKALAAAGYLPVTIDNLSTGYRQAVKWGPLHETDIRDEAVVAALIGHYRPVGAIHFAASSLVGESAADPLKYYDNNVAAAVAFTRALIAGGIEAFVFSSTAAVYGTPEVSPISESHPTAPINPYGASKLAFEGALKWFGAAHPFRWAALRYFNAAGADPEGETGESHEPETHLIPNLIKAALGTGPALTVFGDDYPTPDGTPIRDYIHVVDLADAHVLAIRALIEGGEGGEGGVMNAGTGEGVTVKAMIAAATRVLNAPVPYSIGPRRAGDPPALVADASLLQRRLGWRPQHSDIETILRDAALWQRTRDW